LYVYKTSSSQDELRFSSPHYNTISSFTSSLNIAHSSPLLNLGSFKYYHVSYTSSCPQRPKCLGPIPLYALSCCSLHFHNRVHFDNVLAHLPVDQEEDMVFHTTRSRGFVYVYPLSEPNDSTNIDTSRSHRLRQPHHVTQRHLVPESLYCAITLYPYCSSAASCVNLYHTRPHHTPCQRRTLLARATEVAHKDVCCGRCF
jgi:hypothetical protein